MTGVSDEELARYLGDRDARRAKAVRRTLDGLSDRERALLREGAVMGYVRGSMAAGGSQRVPPDEQILVEVVDACLAHPDLYPTLTRYGDRDPEEYGS